MKLYKSANRRPVRANGRNTQKATEKNDMGGEGNLARRVSGGGAVNKILERGDKEVVLQWEKL